MQNINVYHDPLAPDDPDAYTVDPVDASVWRNDNQITWRLISSTHVWVTVVFDAEWVMDGGQQPVQSTSDPMLFTTTGPPPNSGSAPKGYKYTMAIRRLDTGATFRIGKRGGTAIDPDVWNQPQP